MYMTFLLFFFQIFSFFKVSLSSSVAGLCLFAKGEGQSDGFLSPSDIHPSSNLKQLMLSGVSLLAVSNVNNPIGLVGLPYMM
jgi:hypothetical protein